MILSFGWTAKYLPPNGQKDTTRRLWKPRTIAAWQNQWDKDPLKWHTAVNKSLAYGGSRIGRLQLLERPYEERLGDMPHADIIREGGMCSTVEEFIDLYFHGDPDQIVTVVRFKFMSN